MYTQGRGASPLNPGLGKRNSYRVAAAYVLLNGPYLEFYIVAGTHLGTPLPFRGAHRHAGDLRFGIAAAYG